MRKINKEQYKRNVLNVMKLVREPIWVSDLERRFKLPYANLYGKTRPTQKALWELINDGELILLTPKEYKLEGRKNRRKLSLPSDDPLTRHAKSYFEVQLVDKIRELEAEIKKPWYKKLFT